MAADRLPYVHDPMVFVTCWAKVEVSQVIKWIASNPGSDPGPALARSGYLSNE
jgi:hypothetical protein